MSKRIVLASIILFSSFFCPLQNSFGLSASQLHPGTGGTPLTAAQLAEFRRTHYRIKSVNLNQLGLSRVNLERAKNNLALIEQFKAAPFGSEIESVNDYGSATPQAVSTVQPLTGSTVLPTSVDNSAEPWFPPIGNQGYTNSCQAWAATYYQLTYMNAMAKNWTVSNGDTTKIFSPKWTYNMLDGGRDGGVVGATGTVLDTFPLLETNGAATMSQFPWDGNITKWDLDPDDWQQALSARENPVVYVSSPGATAANITTWITQMKQLLANGYVLTFGTYVDSWRPNPILNPGPAAADNQCSAKGSDTNWGSIGNASNSSLIGQKIYYWQDGGCGGHVMTIVGYDDSVWVDINGNGKVDAGETGAFKIANQWGDNVVTNNGFMWLAYDALYPTSQVSSGPAQAATSSGGWPSTGRWPAIWDNQAYEITVKPNYTPKIIAKFTVNVHPRDLLTMSLGTSTTTATAPANTWSSNGLNDDGGALAFDGTASSTASSNTATFVLDFTDLVPSANTAQNYYLGGLSGTLLSYQLIDLTTGTTTSASNLAITSGHSAPITYTYAGHIPPTAKIILDPPTEAISGTSSLTIQFDGSSSTPASGSTITTYSWNFGDGSTGTGSPIVSHTYTNLTQTAAFYNVVLTVTDNQGGTGSYTFPDAITMGPLPNPPVASATTTPPSPISGTAPLTVNFASSSTDAGGTITSYTWNFGDGNTMTSSTPAVSYTYTTVSTTSERFQPTLIITDNRGATASALLSPITLQAVTTPPIAKATTPASPISGTAPLAVIFDGSASTTASGDTITSYNWSFGDGNTTTSSTNPVNYTYTTAGAFTPKLQVEDSRGITSAWKSLPAVTVAPNPNPTGAPIVTTPPASVTLTAPATASFTVAASGTAPLTYQWQRNGFAISGATGTSYTTPATTTGNNNDLYNVVVTNTVGSVTSSAATLTVNPPATAPAITTGPASATVTAPATASFNVTASGTAPLSYQWYLNGSAISGATGSSYTTPGTSAGSYSYTVTVSNSAGAVTSSAATLTVNAAAVAPSITTQPASVTVTTPATATFSIVAAGTAPLTYQWQKNGVAISGATSASYTTPATTISNNGTTYRVVVSNSAGSVTSSSATLTVHAPVAPSITTQPAGMTVTSPATATFSVVAAGTAPLTYQWQKNDVAISGAAGTSYTTPVTTINDNDETYRVVVTNAAGSMVSSTAILRVLAAPIITTQPANVTVTAPAPARFTVAATGTAPLTYQWKKNGTAIAGATGVSYTTPATTISNTGDNYTVVVSNSAGSVTSSSAILMVDAVPSFTTQPANVTVTAPAAATFSAVAVGTGLLTYQWEKNGVAISGATLPFYTTPATTTSNNGDTYKVVVTDSLGSVASNTVTLSVNAVAGSPIITAQPGNVTVIAPASARFAVVATGTGILTYQWQKNGVAITGATGPSYTTPPTTTGNSGTTYKVIVTNPAGSVTSSTATLSVK